MHALASLLYPFSWQHTFIPVLPSQLLEVVESPTPFIVGVMTSDYNSILQLDMDQVVILDADNDQIYQAVGKHPSTGV